MKILVTGARGQLGAELCDLLRGRGDEVLALGRESMDFLKPGTLDAQVKQHAPDWVINCAAYTQVDKAEEEVTEAYLVNRDSAAALARSIRETGGRLAHVSTDYVFDGAQGRPYHEDDDGCPLNVYGKSKWEGEEAVRSIDDRALIIRTAWVYGASGTNFVKTILRLAQERDELRIVSDQIGTPSWARDIAHAIVELVDKQELGTYHFTNEGVASWYDFALAITEEAANLGFDLRVRRLLPITTREFPRPAVRPACSVLGKEKIRRKLDNPIPHWRESLRNMLRELRECQN